MPTKTSTSAIRRARARQDIRERIIDAARELFAAEGYDAVTMRRVAEQIEYTVPIIYQHFADKASLIREICHRDFREFAATFQELREVSDPIERLRHMGERYIEFGLKHPNHYRLMFMTPLPSDGTVKREEMKDVEAKGKPELDAYAFLRAAVADAFRQGRFRKELTDPALVAHVLWQGMHGVVSMHIAREGDDWIEWRDPRETARLLSAAVMRGLTIDA